MPAWACEGAENIRLNQPVAISAELLAEFKTLPPLTVMAVDAPPMARYNPERQTYEGIGTDVLCFISQELGIRYEIVPGRDETTAEKIRQVQQGQADVFIPLSHSPERARQGLFTLPYYASFYAVITRHDSPAASVRSMDELAQYRVAYVKGVSFEPMLKAIVPPDQLHIYDQTTSDGLFQAAVDGKVDAVVFNKDIFIEKRYRQEFFDLDIALTLEDHPRAYRFYFSQTPEHQQLVQAFDLYLAAIDMSASVNRHETGERHFLERYIAQREQRVFMQVAVAAALLLTVIFGLAFLRYRRLSRQLSERNLHVQQQQQALQAAYQELEALSLTDSPAAEAQILAERMQQGMAAEQLPNALATPPQLTLSIGIATLLQGDPGPQELFELADAQLYNAKKAGRNKICATVLGQ